MLCLRDIFKGATESVDCTVGEYVFISHMFKSDFPAKKKSSNSLSTSPGSTDSVRSQRATQHHRKKETFVQRTWRNIFFFFFFLVIGHEDYFRKSDPWAVLDSTHNHPTLIVSALSERTRVDQSRTRRARNTKKKVGRTCRMGERERGITRCTGKHLLNTIPPGLTNFE